MDFKTIDQLDALRTRRTFLRGAASGVGLAALATLLSGPRAMAESRGSTSAFGLHHRPRVKRVIFLSMAGGPSHLETFDYKPKLAELAGKPMPKSYTEGKPIAQLQGKKLSCMPPQHPFARHGESGQEISSIFPHMHSIADDLCIIRSMKTEAINHDPAHTFMNTGTTISGRPAMGSWLLYGLGSECEDLPGFIVMTSTGGGQNQPIASRQWHSGFLPGQHQGVHFNSSGDPVLYVNRPQGVSVRDQRELIDVVRKMNSERNTSSFDPEIATRIRQYELAFRMQASVPSLMDLSDESQATLDMYGTKGADGTFNGNCLLARRLAERGVRFIQLYHRGWDHHGDIKKGIVKTGAIRRSGNHGVDSGPEAAWHARRDTGGLGRRVRAHSDGAGIGQGITTFRASRCGWREAACVPARPTAPPTSSATAPRKTSCTFTTCTRRFSIYWASTTSDSFTGIVAASFA